MTTTYKLIASQTLYSNTATINFSNIPASGYTDLLIDISFRNTAAGSGGAIRFNGDTGDNYNWLSLSGSAGSVASNNAPAFVSSGYPLFDNLLLYPNVPSTATADVFSNCQIYIPDAFGNTSKSVLIESVATGMDSTVYVLALYAGRWSGTSPISSINLLIDPYASGSPILQAGSSVSIYGITKKDAPIISGESTFGIQATGGDEVISNGYKYHVFRSSGTLNVASPGWVETLVVAGGGGGGGDRGGGGGAGGVKFASMLAKNGPNNVIVGAGGVGGSVSGAVQPGGNGNDSSILTTTSVGGGGGGRTTANNGANGGSGGGGAFDTSGGVGTSGQGNNGGNGNQVGNPSGTATGSGGGGGSGAAGSNGVANGGGAGGTGTDTWSSILNAVNAGVSGRIAGGGGGATDLRSTNNPGPGGSGGGGAGGGTTHGVQGAVNGVTNTGSGGGAGNGGIPQTPGANGGSGIVIIRYPIS